MDHGHGGAPGSGLCAMAALFLQSLESRQPNQQRIGLRWHLENGWLVVR
jgi:hypothetical protein